MTEWSASQYRLSVQIGHQVMAAREEGASWGDVIAALRHSVRLAEDRRDLDLMIAADAARAAAVAILPDECPCAPGRPDNASFPNRRA